MKKVVVNIITVLSSILLVVIVGEIGMRVFQLVKYQRPVVFSAKAEYHPTYADEKVGWKATENYHNESTLQDGQGRSYQSIVTTDANGFKRFGTPGAHLRILVVGDSFTQAIEVSNTKTYYGILAEKINNAEIYAYGARGYGSLQEFMIIDQVIDKIKPQILILQLCGNDFFNNDYELEARSYENNNGMRRPYLDINGNIFYKDPKNFAYFPEILLRYSRLVHFVNTKIQIIYGDLNKRRSIEREIERDGQEHPAFKHAEAITQKIMGLIKARAAGIPVVAFCVNDPQPYYDAFKRIAGSAGLVFIDGVPEAIKASEQRGQVTMAADRAHWNELGHRIAADKIYEFLASRGVIAPMPTETAARQAGPATAKP